MVNDGPVGPPSDQYGEEGIGLRKHVLFLAAKWREVVLGAIVAAGAGGALMWALWTFLPSYETSADVAIIRAEPTVSIDDTLRTGSTGPKRGTYRDRVAERAAFVGLVRNGDVARAVVERLGGQLDESQNETTLIEDIGAELVTIGVQSEMNNSDLIRITARADSPGKAMDLVNAWTEEYVKVVNRIYERAPARLLAAVHAELTEARKSYDAAQEALETLIASSRSDQLARRIRTRAELIENWVRAQNDALTSDYYTLQRLTSQLNAARVLRAQVRNAGETNTASNRLGILLLKAETYTSAPQAVQMALESNFDTAGAMHAGAAEQSADVDALIAALQERIEEVRRKIANRYQEALSGRLPDEEAAEGSLGKVIHARARSGADPRAGLSEIRSRKNSLPDLVARLEEEVRSMRQEKEREDRIMLESIKNRDLLYSSLNSLENEIVELNLVKASEVSTEVRLASTAVLPEYPTGPHPVLAAAVSGFVGLFGMACFLLLMRSEDAQPLLRN